MAAGKGEGDAAKLTKLTTHEKEILEEKSRIDDGRVLAFCRLCSTKKVGSIKLA